MKRIFTTVSLILLSFTAVAEEKTSGQGDWVFKFRPDLSSLPEGADAHIRKAHGGFAVDRQGKGDVYFHLDGYGIIHLSPDLGKVRKLDGDAEFTQGNGHNTSVGYRDGKPYLVIPDNKRGKILFADTEGKLLHSLGRPEVLDWFVSAGFAPTDTLVIGDKVFVADGYGSRYIFPADAFGDYTKGVYGGRPMFTTSHGLDFNPVTKQVAVADREAFQIRYFNQDGSVVREGRKHVISKLPEGAAPCDIDFMPDGTAVVGCLKGEGGAPGEVYILDPQGKVVSCIKPKVDLGLSEGNQNVQHVHNASWTKVGDTVFLLVYAWNPGGFVVLERVSK